MRIKIKLRSIILICLTLLWMAVIFAMSAKPAADSTDMSISLGRVLYDIFMPDYGDLSEEEQLMLAEDIDHPLRKAAHITEYAVLGALVVMTLNDVEKPRKGRNIAAAAVSVIYAFTDELHQYFVPGRSAELRDVAIDSAGVLIGVLLYLLISGMIRKRKLKRTSQEN